MLTLRRLTNPKTLQTLALTFLSKPQPPPPLTNPPIIPFSWTRNLSTTTEKEEDDDDGEVGIFEGSENEVEVDGEKGGKKPAATTLQLVYKVMDMPRLAVDAELDKWVADGNEFGRGEIVHVLNNLRRRRLYGKALQVLNWVERKKRIEFEEIDYASRLDLIAKLFGLHKAEQYINQIPEAFRGQLIYHSLLANYVANGNINKAEATFKKISELGLSITTFACNQLLLMYKRLKREKIGDILRIMEKKILKPSPFTYSLLIAAKGHDDDISGMEKILKMMKADGVEPDVMTRAMIAKSYISKGLSKKAEAVVKELEGDDIKENRFACKALLPLYAELGKADDVERIWQVCEANPRIEECLAAIEAWGKLGQIENAEKVFEYILESFDKVSAKYYNALLKVYADHKLLSKGKALAKRMSENGCRIGPVTWEAIVQLFVDAGEVEKADAILLNAEHGQNKPFYNTYMAVLDEYAKRGDVQNAENVFNRLRNAGYTIRMKPYESLIEAYRTAKMPTHGFLGRMKADKLVPHQGILAKLMSRGKSDFSKLLD